MGTSSCAAPALQLEHTTLLVDPSTVRLGVEWSATLSPRVILSMCTTRIEKKQFSEAYRPIAGGGLAGESPQASVYVIQHSEVGPPNTSDETAACTGCIDGGRVAEVT